MNRISEGAQSAARILNLHRVDTLQLAGGVTYMVQGEEKPQIDYAGPEPVEEDDEPFPIDEPIGLLIAAVFLCVVVIAIGHFVGWMA